MSTTDSEAPIWASPQEEHEWLRRLVGEWTYTSEAEFEPGQGPTRIEGTEQVRSFGDLWLLLEASGDIPGIGPSRSLMTLGYDPGAGRFVGTFVGSTMTHLWIYDEGQLSDDRRSLVLTADGPDPGTPGRMARYKDVIEMVSDDHRVLRAFVQGANGSWEPLMETHYHRTR